MPTELEMMGENANTSADILSRLAAQGRFGVISRTLDYAPLIDLTVLARVSKAIGIPTRAYLENLRLKTTVKALTSFAKHPDIAGKKTSYTVRRLLRTKTYQSAFPDVNTIDEINKEKDPIIRLSRLTEHLAVPLEYYLNTILSSEITFNNLPSEAIGFLTKSIKFLKLDAKIIGLLKKIRVKLSGYLFELHTAHSANGAIVALTLLMHRGADINTTREAYGWEHTPLTHYIQFSSLFSEIDRLRVLNELFKVGADVNKKTKTTTALIAATKQDRTKLPILKRLIAAGAKVNDGDGKHNHYFDIGIGNTALMLAYDAEKFEYLLEEKADVNAVNNEQQSALMRFAKNPVKVEKLIKAGAEIDKADIFGCTALIHACKTYDKFRPDNLACIKLLIEAGADVNASSYCGDTALIIVSRNGRGGDCEKQIISLLIRSGAIVNAKNKDDETALSLRLNYRTKYPKDTDQEIIDLLTSNGAIQPPRCIVM